MAKLLDGEYFYDSCFYDTAEYTARLNEATIAKVQERPQDWAALRKEVPPNAFYKATLRC